MILQTAIIFPSLQVIQTLQTSRAGRTAVESAEATRQGLGQEQRKGSTSDRITTPK